MDHQGVAQPVWETQGPDHEMEKTARAVNETIGVLRTAKDDETRQAMATKLRGLLSDAFARDYELRDEALKKVEARIEQLRKQLERQKQTQDEVIDVRVKSLLFEAEGLGGPIDFGRRVRPNIPAGFLPKIN